MIFSNKLEFIQAFLNSNLWRNDTYIGEPDMVVHSICMFSGLNNVEMNKPSAIRYLKNLANDDKYAIFCLYKIFKFDAPFYSLSGEKLNLVLQASRHGYIPAIEELIMYYEPFDKEKFNFWVRKGSMLGSIYSMTKLSHENNEDMLLLKELRLKYKDANLILGEKYEKLGDIDMAIYYYSNHESEKTLRKLYDIYINQKKLIKAFEILSVLQNKYKYNRRAFYEDYASDYISEVNIKLKELNDEIFRLHFKEYIFEPKLIDLIVKYVKV